MRGGGGGDLGPQVGQDLVAGEAPDRALRVPGGLLDAAEDLGSQYTLALLSRFELPPEEMLKLFAYSHEREIFPFVTPWDLATLQFLEQNRMQAYKVASADLTNHDLLRALARTGKPLICSTGMASEAEINLAVKTLKDGGSPQVALLHCISSYPAKPAEMNLATIPDLAQKFQTIVDLSDHSLSNEVALTAVALGAAIIEKHFTLSRKAGGPDAAFSVEPAELTGLVKEIRRRESNKSAGAPAELPAAIGRPSYGTGEGQAENKIFRRSLFTSVATRFCMYLFKNML